MLRVLHTADWHLGHTLYDYDRGPEHQAFLDFLLKTLASKRVDLLVVAGDIFDTANPPVSALSRWYRFLAQATERLPDLQIVAIGGNHDSAARLDAPEPLLSERVHVVGGLPRRSGRELDLERLLVPIHKAGARVGWIAAIPYLRIADLPRVPDAPDDPVLAGVARIHQQVFAALAERARPGEIKIACGHGFWEGGSLSPDSERKVLGGNQHPIPVDIFPPDLEYVALGHLHHEQAVGRDTIRYSGSPIPLSMTERGYIHQVLQVDLEPDAPAKLTPLPVPRSVDLKRIPSDGYARLEQVLSEIAALEDRTLVPRNLPYLEVRVSLEQPHPDLRRQIDKALEGKAVRLLAVRSETTGSGKALPDHQDLGLLTPEEVFKRRWLKQHEKAPSDAVMAAFHELIDLAEQA